MRLTEGGDPLAHGSDPYRDVQPVPSTDFVLVRRWISFRAAVKVVFTCVAFTFFLEDLFYKIHFGAAWIAISLVALATTYIALGGVLNRTTITVHGGALSVRHGPLPWWGNRTIATADLQRVFFREVGPTGPFERRPAKDYGVGALLKNGQTLNLVSALPDIPQARFIAQTIETHLGLADSLLADEPIE